MNVIIMSGLEVKLRRAYFFGRILNYTNDDNNKYSLTVEILYNPNPNNFTIPANSNFVLVNYKSSDNLAYEIKDGKVFNKVATGDDTTTEFYLLNKGVLFLKDNYKNKIMDSTQTTRNLPNHQSA